MLNPYDGINWSSALRVPSLSHEHGTAEQTVVNLYQEGIRHIAMSNYYPSQPYYPASQYYPGISYADLLFSPNAEHHTLGGPRVNATSQLGSSAHFNSIGSTFSSGSPSGESPVGCDRQDWRVVFSDIIGMLQYADGGGISINHPVWSEASLDVDDVMAMLDYADQVLGIEIYNQSCEDSTQNGWALEMWDEILLTGRRCWGFAVPDHGGEISSSHPIPRPFFGRNILLVPALTERDCLLAYRNGNFYAQLGKTDLRFTSIQTQGLTLTVTTENASEIDVIIDGVPQTISGNSATVTLPSRAVYVRTAARSADDEIFSNPIIFREHGQTRRSVPFSILYG